MIKNLTYADVITVWLDDEDVFKPTPGVPYCFHYKDKGDDRSANVFVDFLHKYQEADLSPRCEKCPLHRTNACVGVYCDRLALIEYEVSADNTVLFNKETGEPIFVDTEQLEIDWQYDADLYVDELEFKLNAYDTQSEIEETRRQWENMTPCHLRERKEMFEAADRVVEARKEKLELGASKKTVRKRTKNGRKTDDATSTVKERLEKEIASKENKTKNGKRTKNGRKSDEPFAPTQALVVPATDPPPVVYAPVDKSEERRKQWEDALLELDKEARRLEFKESLAKEEAKDARNAARAIRQQIKNMLEGGSKNYVEKTPLFNGLDDEDDAMDADDLKEFEKSLDKDMER